MRGAEGARHPDQALPDRGADHDLTLLRKVCIP